MYEWRATFTSSAVAALNDFFLASAELTTNESRAAFAQDQLRNFAFLFVQANGTDRKVSLSSIEVDFHCIIAQTDVPRNLSRPLHTSNLQCTLYRHS
jgi:hypothetical protein